MKKLIIIIFIIIAFTCTKKVKENTDKNIKYYLIGKNMDKFINKSERNEVNSFYSDKGALKIVTSHLVNIKSIERKDHAAMYVLAVAYEKLKCYEEAKKVLIKIIKEKENISRIRVDILYYESIAKLLNIYMRSYLSPEGRIFIGKGITKKEIIKACEKLHYKLVIIENNKELYSKKSLDIDLIVSYYRMHYNSFNEYFKNKKMILSCTSLSYNSEWIIRCMSIALLRKQAYKEADTLLSYFYERGMNNIKIKELLVLTKFAMGDYNYAHKIVYSLGAGQRSSKLIGLEYLMFNSKLIKK